MMNFKQVRDSFWEAHPEFRAQRRSRKKQNDYCTDIRCAFVDYVDYLRKDGQITDQTAQNVTL